MKNKSLSRAAELVAWLCPVLLIASGFGSVSLAEEAGGVNLEASLNRATLMPGERAMIQVTVTGIQTPPTPSIRAPEGVIVRSLARMELANGPVGTRFTFGVVAAAEGTYTLGPVELRAAGSVYRSNPLTLRVGGTPKNTAEGGSGDVFMKAEIDNNTPYLGEQVVYTVRIFRSVNIFKMSYEPAVFEGLVVAGDPRVQEYSTVEVGRNLSVEEYRYALYATRAGSARIGEARFACKIKVGTKAGTSGLFDDEYTGRSEDSLSVAPALALHVKPLPPGPADFSSLVGKTEVVARLTPPEVPEGGTATLTLEVQSTGNVLGLAAPTVDGLSSFQTIPDSSKTEWLQRDQGQFLGRLTLRTALIPTRPGSYDIPPVRLVFFDPLSGTYRTAKSEVQRMAVLRPGERPRMAGASSTEVSARGSQDRGSASSVEEIRGIRTTPTNLDPGSFTGPPATGWLVLAGIPWLGFAAAFAYGRHRDRIRTDPAFARRRRAFARARAKLAEARRIAGAAKGDVFFGLLGKVIREYVGDRLNLPGAALTPQEIEERIRVAGAMDGVEVSAREFLLSCEYRQLATGEGGEARGDFLECAQELLRRLEKELPR